MLTQQDLEIITSMIHEYLDTFDRQDKIIFSQYDRERMENLRLKVSALKQAPNDHLKIFDNQDLDTLMQFTTDVHVERKSFPFTSDLYDHEKTGLLVDQLQTFVRNREKDSITAVPFSNQVESNPYGPS